MPARDEDGNELTLESLARRVRELEKRQEGHDMLTSLFGRVVGGAVALSAVGSFLMLLIGGKP